MATRNVYSTHNDLRGLWPRARAISGRRILKRRVTQDRRYLERRRGKRGVNVRHEDEYPQETKRIARGRFAKKEKIHGGH